MHLEYASQIENRVILMAVEAYSKWINAMVVCSSILNVIIQQLRMLFAEEGLPEDIVADNASLLLIM